MNATLSRRHFAGACAFTAAAVVLRTPALLAAPAKIRYGYAAITWGNAERQAVEDIASAGYRGIQLRANVLTDFQPAELRDLLAQHKLTFVALSSGDLSLDEPADAQIDRHVANAKFLRDSGGMYLQILDKLKGHPRDATPDECRRLGAMLTELGKRTADLGIPLVYHNHLNTFSEKPANLDLIMEHSDARYVKLLLDVAHSTAGGGDPAAQIDRYHDRIQLLHLKDFVDLPPAPGASQRYPFQWVELGRGRVKLPAVYAALEKHGYRGWAIVELDRVPDSSVTPKTCALTSKMYLEQTLHQQV